MASESHDYDRYSTGGLNGYLVPYEIEPDSVPGSLKIQQRGADPKHFEIMPREFMAETKYKEDLGKIRVKPLECS